MYLFIYFGCSYVEKCTEQRSFLLLFWLITNKIKIRKQRFLFSSVVNALHTAISACIVTDFIANLFLYSSLASVDFSKNSCASKKLIPITQNCQAKQHRIEWSGVQALTCQFRHFSFFFFQFDVVVIETSSSNKSNFCYLGWLLNQFVGFGKFAPIRPDQITTL